MMQNLQSYVFFLIVVGGQETLGRSSGRPSLDLGGMGRGLFSRGGNVLFRVDAISDSSTSEMFKSGLSSMRRMMNKISNNNQVRRDMASGHCRTYNI